MTTILDRNN